MKRNLLLTVLFTFSCAMVFAQRFSNLPKIQPVKPGKAVPAVKTAYTGFETATGNLAESVPPSGNFGLDVVGSTVYDLQSNGGSGHRVYNSGNGNVAGVFTLSINPASYPDRGTGYNNAAAGVWGPSPAARTESARTGFTNLCVGPDGTEYTFAHLGAGVIRMAKRASGATSWTESDIPSPTTVLWSRAAVGGADGKTIHMICSTMPTGNGGTTFQGMNGVVIYHRSTDGGATWDIQGALLPGIDSTAFSGTDVEGYQIDADGNDVSILVLNTWNDCLAFTSSDNGTTWESRIVNDFPLDNYVVNAGYDPTTLPPDPNQPASIYDIFTSDGTGDILVKDGITHVWYGATYVNDSIIDDTGWTFYPGTNIGIVYWNSLMDDNAGVISGFCPDVDNSGVLEITDIANYGLGLSTHPAAAIDNDGNLIVVYSTVHELYLDLNSGSNYRQPWLCASQDLGQTWNAPRTLLNPDLLGSDSTEIPFLECIFNSTAKWADDKVHAIFQADFSPLTFLNNSDIDTESGDNQIRYVGYPTAWALATSTTNVSPESMKFVVTPNPANDRVVLQFTSTRTQESWVELYDLQGRVVRSTPPVTMGAGEGTTTINVSDLNNGMYIARLNLGNQFATQKVVVRH